MYPHTQPCKRLPTRVSRNSSFKDRKVDGDDKSGSSIVNRYFRDPGVFITNIGMASNLGLALIKLLGGWAFSSDTMLADGWHSLSDLLADILTLATVVCGITDGKENTKSRGNILHHLGGFVHSGMLFSVGCALALRSTAELGRPGGVSTSPSVEALWISLVTIAIKEWLYRSTMKVAQEQNSQILASNATHHRVDGLSSMVTALAILMSLVGSSTFWVDPLGGLSISLMILASSGKTFVKACQVVLKGTKGSQHQVLQLIPS